ncbi:MAG TPA: TPM domain-containing protein [Candidatus Rifleibacterium sp.]|nr:TPM domain-containing protein [Candidatus Rifleibacterium sp.]HPT44925.1 TPM domain-containing protein [Candidatus Rifleibacterium sp.]
MTFSAKAANIILIMALLFTTVFCGAETASAPVAQLATGDAAVAAPRVTDAARFIDDRADLIKPDLRAQIVSDCAEIEEKMRIRVFIRTTHIENLADGQNQVETFFSEWIRSISLDKRGILIYALLPEGAAHGKVHLRVGIGLKYLVTREMGEKILNQVILPNNAANNDGMGFLEGVRAIRRMLLDELKRDEQRATGVSRSFDLRFFLWSSKEILLALLIGLFLFYVIFFVERCPRCNGALKVSSEMLKEPGKSTLGLQRKIYACERCGFSRRKKEPVYPSGRAGLIMRLTGARRNVRIE